MKISSASLSEAVERLVADQVRVHRGDGLARARPGGDRADLQIRVAREQAQQLPARIAAGPSHRNPNTHAASLSLQKYAS
jgi:hypothetical protein